MSAFALISQTAAALPQDATDDGLTFAEVVANLPADPLSLIVMLMLGFSLGLVLWTGRDRTGAVAAGSADGAPTEPVDAGAPPADVAARRPAGRTAS